MPSSCLWPSVGVKSIVPAEAWYSMPAASEILNTTRSVDSSRIAISQEECDSRAVKRADDMPLTCCGDGLIQAIDSMAAGIEPKAVVRLLFSFGGSKQRDAWETANDHRGKGMRCRGSATGFSLMVWLITAAPITLAFQLHTAFMHSRYAPFDNAIFGRSLVHLPEEVQHALREGRRLGGFESPPARPPLDTIPCRSVAGAG